MIAKRYRLVLILLLLLSVLTLSALGVGAAFRHALPLQDVMPNGPGNHSVAAGSGVVCYGYVDLEFGCTSLHPLETGRVARVLVRENEKVATGAPLVSLEDQSARARVATARAGLSAAQSQFDQAKTMPKRHQLTLALQRFAIAALDNKVAAAQTTLALKKELAENKLANLKEVDIAQVQIKELEALREGERTKLTELQLRDPALEVNHAEAELEGARGKLTQAEQALTECTLKAPQAGTVVRILVAPGDVLVPQARQAAMLFAPDEPRIIRAEVEQEFAARVSPGQSVLVQDDVNPSLTGRGTVQRVSDWYLPRRTVFQEPNRLNDTRTLECIVTLEPGQPPMRIGQRVRVMIGAGEP